ncbi:uncharacterized protein LOC117332976 [Pecten maximus]|uniref:uncharacterized protein LOC117332976 n=1 Tax=Pecten maximus TaxID=6579 RepID=UPI001458DAF8|nr:uncharacterized protein LOC117332976 [Pecten maximus]
MADTKITTRKIPESEGDIAYYIEDQPREARQRYETKLTYDKGQKSLPNPYRLSSGWVNDISTWPDLTYGDIYNYLIDSPGVYTKESMKAYKSLDAYRYVQSGHVQEVYYHPLDDRNLFCFLKAKVVPSQRVNDKPHQPWICVNKDSGNIYCAHCTCMAGLGEACSHIAALMFKIQIAVHMGLTTKSSTSDICKWNSTFRKEIEPKTVSEMQGILKDGNRTHPVATVHATSRDPLPSDDIIKALKDVCPGAVFFTTIPPVGPQETVEKPKKTEKAPATITSLFCTDNIPSDTDGLKDKCQEVWTSYIVTHDPASFIEQSTRNQNVCSRWFEHRKGRITASKAHDVFVRRDSTKPDNLVRRIVGYQSYDLSKTKSVSWGLDNEDTAREQYRKAMTSVHSNFVVRKSGLLIDSNRPYL